MSKLLRDEVLGRLNEKDFVGQYHDIQNIICGLLRSGKYKKHPDLCRQVFDDASEVIQKHEEYQDARYKAADAVACFLKKRRHASEKLARLYYESESKRTNHVSHRAIKK